MAEREHEQIIHTDLENIIGNYLVTKYQFERLTELVANQLRIIPPNADGSPRQTSSDIIFKEKDDWYKIHISLEKQEGLS